MFNEDISKWDVGNVTNMYRNVSNVVGNVTAIHSIHVSSLEIGIHLLLLKTMHQIVSLHNAVKSFNQEYTNIIGIHHLGMLWTTMLHMNSLFTMNAAAFNQDLNGWNTGSLLNAMWMFRRLESLLLTSFNHDIRAK